jgi:hypothetical protein
MGVSLYELRQETNHEQFLFQLLSAEGFEGELNEFQINKFIDRKFPDEKIDVQTVELLREHIKPHPCVEQLRREILEKKSIKDAFVYCKLKELSPQRYGSLLEHFIIKKEKMKKNKASEARGDCWCPREGVDYEIKVSNYNNDRFTFCQIRLCQKVDYLLYAYSLNEQNVDRMGELFQFKITHDQMKGLVLKHGSRSHGTKNEKGKITASDLEDKEGVTNKHDEFTLQPSLRSPCWKAMQKFIVK